jgi:hypothetical protein
MAAAGAADMELARRQMELRSAESQVDALKHEVVASAEDARAAREALASYSEAAEAAAALARAQLSERERALRDTRGELEALQGRYARDTAALAAAALEERVAAAAEAQRREEELKLQLQEARFQVERGAVFLDQKTALETQVDSLQATLTAEGARHNALVADMERRFIAEKLGMQRTLELSREAMEHAAKKEAFATLHDAQKRVLQANEGMGSEIVHLSVETRKLTKNLTELGAARGSLQREVKDLQSAEALWAERCARQALRVKALEARVAELEGGAAAAAAARAAADAAQAARFAKESEDLRVEALGLRALLAHKNKELATVKRLAGAVLAQRTEVEHFFLDSLALVKLEVLTRKRAAAEEAAAAAAAGASAAGKGAAAAASLPRTRGGSAAPAAAPAAPPVDAGAVLGLSGLRPHQQHPILVPVEGVDLFDLGPSDRERVLRALFAHLQQGERSDGVGAAAATAAAGGGGSPRQPPTSRSSDSAAPASAAAATAPDIMSRPFGVLAGAQL